MSCTLILWILYLIQEPWWEKTCKKLVLGHIYEFKYNIESTYSNIEMWKISDLELILQDYSNFIWNYYDEAVSIKQKYLMETSTTYIVFFKSKLGYQIHYIIKRVCFFKNTGSINYELFRQLRNVELKERNVDINFPERKKSLVIHHRRRKID